MEAILKIMDRLSRISEQDSTPPSIPDKREDSAETPNELREFYKEIHGDMRALRDTEFKITSLFYQVAAFIFAGNLTLIASANARIPWTLKAVVLTTSLAFIFEFWRRVHSRIAHDNLSYRFLMGHKRSIDSRWFGSGFTERPKHLGAGAAGPGYRKTQSLVACSAVSVIVVLGFLLYYTLPNC